PIRRKAASGYWRPTGGCPSGCTTIPRSWRAGRVTPLRRRSVRQVRSEKGDVGRLGDLRRRRGRNLGVGLADDAVAAVALGRIEAGVGALDQRLNAVAGAMGGDADRDRDAAEVLAGRALHQFLAHDG